MFLMKGASLTADSTIILAFSQDIVTQLQFTCHSFLLKISHCICLYVKEKKQNSKTQMYFFYFFLRELDHPNSVFEVKEVREAAEKAKLPD